jgi:hypothetical protein
MENSSNVKPMLNYSGPKESIFLEKIPLPSILPGMKAIFLHADQLQVEYFLLEEHQAIFEFWSNEPRKCGLPLSSGLDPLKFRIAVGTVMLLEPNDDGSDFFYRIHGTRVSDSIGRSFNKKWLSDIQVPTRNAYLGHYKSICVHRCPAYSEIPAARQYSSITSFSRLTLPMVDDTGRVNRLLASTVPLSHSVV